MRSNEYWANRAKERMMFYHDDSNKTLLAIADAYDKALKDIEGDLKGVLDKYAQGGNLSPEDARRYLNEKIPNFMCARHGQQLGGESPLRAW